MPLRGTCLTPDCKSKTAADCKGLCMRCYSTAKKMVEAGRTTWGQLEQLGLIEMGKDAFTKAFEQKRGE